MHSEKRRRKGVSLPVLHQSNGGTPFLSLLELVFVIQDEEDKPPLFRLFERLQVLLPDQTSWPAP